MRTIVIGDLHGCHRELKSLISRLKKKGAFTPETDRLIFIGDYIDRGENPRLTVRYVRGLQKKYGENVIALMGNHEDMLLEEIQYGSSSWLYNGARNTLLSYEGHEKDFDRDVRWMKDLPLYYEDDYFVYVHAGVNKDLPIDQQDRHTLLWARQGFYLDPRGYEKTVIFGHTPTQYLNGGDKPLWMNNDHDIAIDTGCVYNGKLTALIIENDRILEYIQVDRKKPAMEGAE